MMTALLTVVNRLLPFATPGTPIIQDLVHLAALCTLLYYGPQIQASLRNAAGGTRQQVPGNQEVDETPHENATIADETRVPDVGHADNDNRDQNQVPAVAHGQAHLHIPHHRDPNPNAEGERPEINTDQRNIGAKKAKSLARKDQRRAYHEFQRAQGEAQRARDAEGAAEREASLEAARRRRKDVEAAMELKKAREREEKRRQDQRQHEEEALRRTTAVLAVRERLASHGMCDLSEVARSVDGNVDAKWVEKIVHASGILKREGNSVTFLTTMGWVVSVTEDAMAHYYENLLQTGEVTFTAMHQAHILGESINCR